MKRLSWFDFIQAKERLVGASLKAVSISDVIAVASASKSAGFGWTLTYPCSERTFPDWAQSNIIQVEKCRAAQKEYAAASDAKLEEIIKNCEERLKRTDLNVDIETEQVNENVFLTNDNFA